MADGRSERRQGLVLSPAPHLRTSLSSAGIAWRVSLALAPATVWGVVLFGLPAVFALLAAIGSALAFEALAALLFRRFTLGDGSAFLTGLLVGLLMPPGAPLYVPVAAAAFAILVIKWSFGGLGRNWMNPAVGGVVFASLSWPTAMTQWVAARGWPTDSVPPLSALRAALESGAGAGSPLATLATAGYRFSSLDERVISWINGSVFAPFGVALAPGSLDVLIGHVAGRIGEVSAPLLLAGAGFLLARKIIRVQTPVAYVASFAILALLFGGLPSGLGWITGGPGFHLLSGSIVLGAFFLASDPVTSPLSARGRWIYGAGLGVLTFFLRFFGSSGDGVALAILLGNCAVPLLDRLARRSSSGGQEGIA
jgi:electron transport complex protein RnfD